MITSSTSDVVCKTRLLPLRSIRMTADASAVTMVASSVTRRPDPLNPPATRFDTPETRSVTTWKLFMPAALARSCDCVPAIWTDRDGPWQPDFHPESLNDG